MVEEEEDLGEVGGDEEGMDSSFCFGRDEAGGAWLLATACA